MASPIPAINPPGIHVPTGAPPPQQQQPSLPAVPATTAPVLTTPAGVVPPVGAIPTGSSTGPLPPVPPVNVLPAVPTPINTGSPPGVVPIAQPAPTPIPEPQSTERGERTGPLILTNLPIAIPPAPFGFAPGPVPVRAMSTTLNSNRLTGVDPFAPRPGTVPGPFARVPGQAPVPVHIPGVNDPIPTATGPRILTNMPMNPIPMPMNPCIVPGGIGATLGPPLPVPSPAAGQGLALPPMPAVIQAQPQAPAQTPLMPIIPPLVPQADPHPSRPSVSEIAVPLVAPPPVPPPYFPLGPGLHHRPKLPPIVTPAPPFPAPKLPSWIIIFSFVAFLALIAEVDSMSKYVGRTSTKYAGASGGNVLQRGFILALIAGLVCVIFFLSYVPPIKGPTLILVH